MRRMLLMLCVALLLTNAALADVIEHIAIAPDCLAVSTLTDEADLITEQTMGLKVIDLARQALLAHHPEADGLMDMPYDARATHVLLSDGSAAWVGSVFTQMDEVPMEAVLTINAETMALLRYEENNTGWFGDTQLCWENVYGAYGRWPLEAQHLFDLLYCVEVTHILPGEDTYPFDDAYTAAINAAGLSASRDTMSYERTLIRDPYGAYADGQAVWVITLMLDTKPLAQVNVSAVDGHIIDLFDDQADVG